MNDKAVTEVMGGILILLVMVLTISVLFMYGIPVIEETQTSIRMRNMITQMVSLHEQMVRVSVDVIPNAIFRIPTSDGSLEIKENHFQLYVNNSTMTLYSINDTMNKIEYVYGERAIAIENGGVWRRDDRSSNTIMVERPRIHVSGDAVTISFTKIIGTGSAGGRGFSDVEINLNSSETRVFNTSGYVVITVDSDYDAAWMRYFESLNANVTGNTANITFNRLVISKYVLDVEVL
jgi:hypothetical protein